MRRSVILDVCVRAEFHTLILVSLYFLFAGHNQPGGGFSGGLVASCAFCLLYVVGRRGGGAPLDEGAADDVPRASACCSRSSTGIVPLLLGGEFLENVDHEGHLPVIGEVHRRPRCCSSTPACTSSCSGWCC